MDSADTNDTAPHHDRGWTGLQRAGFAVVLLAAAATLGLATLTNPQGPTSAHTSEVTEQQVATRGGGQIINGCTIQPDAQCAGANLRGASLNGVDLHGANLAGANLVGAYLHFADLRGANLEGAYLNGAYLNGANLSDANLADANLHGANLYWAGLRRADLDGARFQNTVMPDYTMCSGRIADCRWQP